MELKIAIMKLCIPCLVACFVAVAKANGTRNLAHLHQEALSQDALPDGRAGWSHYMPMNDNGPDSHSGETFLNRGRQLGSSTSTEIETKFTMNSAWTNDKACLVGDQVFVELRSAKYVSDAFTSKNTVLTLNSRAFTECNSTYVVRTTIVTSINAEQKNNAITVASLLKSATGSANTTGVRMIEICGPNCATGSCYYSEVCTVVSRELGEVLFSATLKATDVPTNTTTADTTSTKSYKVSSNKVGQYRDASVPSYSLTFNGVAFGDSSVDPKAYAGGYIYKYKTKETLTS